MTCCCFCFSLFCFFAAGTNSSARIGEGSVSRQSRFLHQGRKSYHRVRRIESQGEGKVFSCENFLLLCLFRETFMRQLSIVLQWSRYGEINTSWFIEKRKLKSGMASRSSSSSFVCSVQSQHGHCACAQNACNQIQSQRKV
jgi:hypothetical protein